MSKSKMYYALIIQVTGMMGVDIRIFRSSLSRERATRRRVYDRPRDADQFIIEMRDMKTHESPSDPDTKLCWLDAADIHFES